MIKLLILMVILMVLIAILFCLGSAGFLLTKHKRDDKEKMAKALAWRVGLSVALFLFLLLSFFMGWITPHGIVF